MIRNLKAFSLALGAIFALSAVVASAASAEFTTGTDSTTLTAKALTNQVFAITGTPGENAEVSCKKISVTGTAPTATTEITVTPKYEECTISDEHTGINVNADIETNGCDFLFTTHENENVHIVCPEGKSIEVKPTILGTARKCLDVHAQTPTVNVVTWTNGTNPETGKMDVTIDSKVEGITWEKTGLCAGETTRNEGNDAKYTGSVTVTGEEGAKAIDVTVNHPE